VLTQHLVEPNEHASWTLLRLWTPGRSEPNGMECLLASYWSGAHQATTGSGVMDAVWKHSTLFWMLFLLH